MHHNVEKMALWKVTNLTATACLSKNHSYDLNKIMNIMRDLQGVSTKYNPKQFCGLTVRFAKPKATILIFESGKLVCIGASEHFVAREVFRQCARILDDKCIKFRIHNYVVSWNIGQMINLCKFARNSKQKASYEPELFPGCFYNLNNTVKVTLFSTGKIFMTGIRDPKNVNQLYLQVMEAINISQALS